MQMSKLNLPLESTRGLDKKDTSNLTDQMCPSFQLNYHMCPKTLSQLETRPRTQAFKSLVVCSHSLLFSLSAIAIMITSGFILLSVASAVGGHESYEGRKYYNIFSGLTRVPNEIPLDTEKVFLYENEISVIKTDAFYALAQCSYLRLDHNTIYVLSPGAFSGMISLRYLTLHHKALTEIRRNVFRGLPFIELTGEHPKVSLTLHDNPLRCEADNLCWLKRAELENRIDASWIQDPDCADWNAIDCNNNAI